MFSALIGRSVQGDFQLKRQRGEMVSDHVVKIAPDARALRGARAHVEERERGLQSALACASSARARSLVLGDRRGDAANTMKPACTPPPPAPR